MKKWIGKVLYKNNKTIYLVYYFLLEKKVLEGFEPTTPDSKSGVLTTTL